MVGIPFLPFSLRIVSNSFVVFSFESTSNLAEGIEHGPFARVSVFIIYTQPTQVAGEDTAATSLPVVAAEDYKVELLSEFCHVLGFDLDPIIVAIIKTVHTPRILNDQTL